MSKVHNIGPYKNIHEICCNNDSKSVFENFNTVSLQSAVTVEKIGVFFEAFFRVPLLHICPKSCRKSFAHVYTDGRIFASAV